jgi:hypothetical protein
LLKANDGSSWDVKSDTASLAEHVGHTVTVTASSPMRRCTTSKKMPRMRHTILV